MGRRRNSSANAVTEWIQKRSIKAKVGLCFLIGILALLAMNLFIRRRRYYFFFLVTEVVHIAGILVLIYKLFTKKTCSGLSLKTQELTALFNAVRVYLSFDISFKPDLHMFLDLTTLLLTFWVIYMMRFKLKFTYNKELDTLPYYYVIIPTVVLALLIHPRRSTFSLDSILWAFCIFVEAVSVLPQLRLMQNAKMAEPFSALYVFALGLSRFLGFAHWIIMIIETRGRFLHFWGYGSIWMLTNLIAEIVQTFILADFCYYYVKRVAAGQVLIPLPV